MIDFVVQLILSFSISMGMILGGSLLGSLASLFVGDFPASTMMNLAERLKIWAAVAGMGGTFTTFRVLESVIWDRQLYILPQQLLIIMAAFSGAHVGYTLIYWVVKAP